LSIADSGTSSPAYVAELFIDGVQVLRSQWSHSATGGQGPILIGGVPTGVGPVLDYLPFSASLDVYVTATGTISGPYFAYLADIHQ
jgi:hypothetical protein